MVFERLTHFSDIVYLNLVQCGGLRGTHEILSNQQEGGSIVDCSGQSFPSFVGGFPFQSVGRAEVGIRVSELLKMMGSQSQG